MGCSSDGHVAPRVVRLDIEMQWNLSIPCDLVINRPLLLHELFALDFFYCDSIVSDSD